MNAQMHTKMECVFWICKYFVECIIWL